jgi:hypothetical protein
VKRGILGNKGNRILKKIDINRFLSSKGNEISKLHPPEVLPSPDISLESLPF